MNNFLTFLQNILDIDQNMCEAVEKAYHVIFESAATDVNPVQPQPDPSLAGAGIDEEEQPVESSDPIVNSLLKTSAASRNGCHVSLASPGRTSLGILGGNCASNGLSCGNKATGAGGQNVCADCSASG